MTEFFIHDIEKLEKDYYQDLEDAYGVGTIDIQKGEFIPAPKQEEAPAPAEEAPAE